MSETRDPRPETRAAALVCVFVALLCSSCGRQRNSEPFTGTVVLTERQALGEKLFFKNCNECHPQGQAGLAPSLNDKALPDVLIKNQVRNPVAFMPPFEKSDLSDEQLDALVDYLNVLMDPDEAKQQAPPLPTQQKPGGAGGGAG